MFSSRFEDEELENGEAGRRRKRGRRKCEGMFCDSDQDYDVVKGMVLDPNLPILNKWNRVFLVACLVSLFVDPVFFFLPVVNVEEGCVEMSGALGVALTVVRSIADVFYITHILVRFRTAYVAPSSRIFGRGELVIHPSKIAANYLVFEFWLHFVAALPLPQVPSLLLDFNTYCIFQLPQPFIIVSKLNFWDLELCDVDLV